MQLTVGKLARRTGLTVRTLHHYDTIGLLVPSMRSGAGYRLYGKADIERLHRIIALRQMGLSLTDIGTALSGPQAPLAELVDHQIKQLDRELTRTQHLRQRLVTLRAQLDSGHPDAASWLDTLESMTMYEKYFSPEEMQALPMLTDCDTQAQWSALVGSIQAAMDRGARPGDADVDVLALRWMDMIGRDTGHNPDFLMRLHDINDREPEARKRSGITEALQHFVEQAVVEARLAIFANYLQPEEMQRMRENYGKQMYAWPPLIAQLRKAMASNLPVDDAHVQPLARRWAALFRAYAGDDPATHARIREAYANEPDLRSGSAVDQALFDYVHRALVAASTKPD
ncbi:MAG TPA: MerR family transcriptional regulator [Oleiagrimonas sp.]|nr:MerR family transcriptional regulator [Oleiagrimonas sp.]